MSLSQAAKRAALPKAEIQQHYFAGTHTVHANGTMRQLTGRRAYTYYVLPVSGAIALLQLMRVGVDDCYGCEKERESGSRGVCRNVRDLWNAAHSCMWQHSSVLPLSL